MTTKDYTNLGPFSTTFYKINNKLLEKETKISKQNKQIDKLKTELIKMYQENNN